MKRALVVLALVAACGKKSETPDEKRVAAWRADLKTFATELPERHKNLFFSVSEREFRAAVDELDGQLATLRQPEVMAGVMRLAALVGDGHTTAWWQPMLGRVHTPLALFVFADGGVVVVDAPAEHAWAIGGQLVAVHGQAIDQVNAGLAEVISHDNLSQLRAQLPDRLTDPMLLDGLGLADAEGRIAYQLAFPDGSRKDLVLGPAKWRRQAKGGKDTPLAQRNHHLSYWNDYVPDEKLVYIQYNACVDNPDLPFATFAGNTIAFIDQNPVDKVAIDLRNNGGGNSMLAWPLIGELAKRKAKVYVIIGRHTFSSALLNAMELDQQAGAILVGEPTGGRPSHYGEVQTFDLPSLSMKVQYSTKFFEMPQYSGDSLEPELPAPPTMADHLAGRDPALERILADGRELP